MGASRINGSVLLALVILIEVTFPAEVDSFRGYRSKKNSIMNKYKVDESKEIYELLERYLEYKACQRALSKVTDWLERTLPDLDERFTKLQQIAYQKHINLTEYNDEMAVEASTEFLEWSAGVSDQATEFLTNRGPELYECNKTMLRMLEYYWLGGCLNPMTSAKKRLKIALESSMEKKLETTTITTNNQTYRLQPELTYIMSTSRLYEELLWVWQAWHDAVGPKVKDEFIQLVDILNEAAVAHGFANAGMVWKRTDVNDIEAERTMTRLMDEIKPLYQQLHAYVRAQLVEKYSIQIKGKSYEKYLDPEGPIPAHLLGNMYSQEWTQIEDLLLPFPDVPLPDVTGSLKNLSYTPKKMFELAEEFFTSLGFKPMTDIFWQKSVIERPSDPNIKMVCHGSAHDMNAKDDFRIAMCTQINLNDLEVIHHEMGHIVYFMEYRKQPVIFRDGANSAFHEAVGDTIALSATSRSHLEAIGLINKLNGTPSCLSGQIHSSCKPQSLDEETLEEIINEKDEAYDYKILINTLMRKALSKVAFLPFAISLEFWRYAVFRGDITPENYNEKWWELRKRFQGIIPPVPRDSSKFDPGSKYHVAANIPYARYFLSHIGLFQFHEALCKTAGYNGPLHNCDIYKSKEAGKKLRSFLGAGSSQSWPVLMEILTGQKEFRSSSILNYFKPLHEWLVKANKDNKIGWESTEN